MCSKFEVKIHFCCSKLSIAFHNFICASLVSPGANLYRRKQWKLMIHTILPSEARQTFAVHAVERCHIVLHYFILFVIYRILWTERVLYSFIFVYHLAGRKKKFDQNNHFYRLTFNLMQRRRKINSTFYYVPVTYVRQPVGAVILLKAPLFIEWNFPKTSQRFLKPSNQLRVFRNHAKINE